MSTFATPINWIQSDALPFWLNHGVDWEKGGFFESFSLSGENLRAPRRAIVQARQIYSLRLAVENGWADSDKATDAVARGADYLVKNFSLPSGAFIYSVSEDGKTKDSAVDLYTQAFALFGLANAFAAGGKPEHKQRAKALLNYLNHERRLQAGGFSEIKSGKILYEANPHMHLFEAAIAWMEVDSDPAWSHLAEEVLELCTTKFIDPNSGLLAEHFDDSWVPLLEKDRFVAEPGHQFEWAWLMGRYGKLKPAKLGPVQSQLFQNSEASGINKDYGFVFDEIWSDLTPKLYTSRTWPQCERIKCACELAASGVIDRAQGLDSANAAMAVLMRFFSTPAKGLWFDRIEETGKLRQESVKASSLYHIAGAISEYQKMTRPGTA